MAANESEVEINQNGIGMVQLMNLWRNNLQFEILIHEIKLQFQFNWMNWTRIQTNKLIARSWLWLMPVNLIIHSFIESNFITGNENWWNNWWIKIDSGN